MIVKTTEEGEKMFNGKHYQLSSSQGCMTNLNLPHKGFPLACAIVTISASFMERLAEFSRTQPGCTMTKPRAADMPSTWSITAKQHNGFQIAPLSLISSTLQQWSSCSENFYCKLECNTCEPCADVCCEIIEINLFQMAPAGVADRQRKCWMKAKVAGITGYVSIFHCI